MAKDDLKNLPPEERIKKLKELEQQKRKEIEDAQKEIKESEKELTEKRKQKEKTPIPQVASSDLESLSEEEKEVVRTHRGLKKEKKEAVEEKTVKPQRVDDSELEHLARERVELPPELMQSEYTLKLSQAPMKDIYAEMTKINRAVEEKGYINAEEQRKAQYLSSAVERKLEDVETGKYSFTESVAAAASLTQQMGLKLRDVYKRSNDLYKN
ncbi:MAG: hypothetical protein WCV90_05730 [Candidatus Woesearchaeota archaeon]|jgi:hypothetical protein